jgi:hypothetical protein
VALAGRLEAASSVANAAQRVRVRCSSNAERNADAFLTVPVTPLRAGRNDARSGAVGTVRGWSDVSTDAMKEVITTY